jgi:hypothetical protein
MSGLTVLLLEKTMPGITTRRIPTMGWWTSCELFFLKKESKNVFFF